jgi:hypothetical protein
MTVANLLATMGYSTFLILGPGWLAPFPLLLGLAGLAVLLVLHRRRRYSLGKALGAILLGAGLGLVYLVYLVLIGTSMIRSVLPPP